MVSYLQGFLATVLSLLNLVLVPTDGQSLSKSPRTCVIGAGYSGLGTARYLKEYNVDFTVFEASRHIGGTWRFDPHIGTDEDGLPVYTSMYKGMRTNTPVQTMEYKDFPFPKDTPSYPTGTCFYKYLKAFATKFGLLDHIQVRSFITNVKWVGNHWNVTYTKTDTRETITEGCDFVVVASGEHCYPKWPKLRGMDTFKGQLIHCHDYKDPAPFTDRRVLLVGAGPSGLDLAMYLSNVTAKLVHSHHLKYKEPYYSESYVKKPDIRGFTKYGAVFEDGSFEEIDVVLFCTGYIFSHPFLDSSTGVTATDKYVTPLYQQIVNIRHPTMAFVGVAKWIIKRILDAQGQYVAALAAGKLKLPSQEKMLQSWQDLAHAQKDGRIDNINLVPNMENYANDLTKEAGLPHIPAVLSRMWDYNIESRMKDILNYRDYDWTILNDTHYKREYVYREEYPCPFDKKILK